MTDNTMREGKLWALLRDNIHDAYKKLSTTGTSAEYHALLDSTASKVADDVDDRFLQAAQSVPVMGEPVLWALCRGDKLVYTSENKEALCRNMNFSEYTLVPLCKAPATSIAAQELDALRKDAERYRWIRDKSHSLETRQYDKGIVNGPSCYHEVEGIRELKYEGALDAAIDAAIAQDKGE